MPIQTVITLLGQMLLFHEHFNTVQYICLGVIFCLYIAQGIYVIKFQKKKETPKTEAEFTPELTRGEIASPIGEISEVLNSEFEEKDN